MLPEVVREKLALLPVQSGVYLFKNTKGEVVYVGKAKSLRSRVRSYFQAGGSDTRYFIPLLQEIIADFDTIVTSNEKEATILENNLIKEHSPRFNVKLRDDKEYLSLRLALTHAWPRLSVVRRPAQDGCRYFGPYHSATAARRTLHLVNKHFQLRTCSDTEFAARKRPCLQYQIKRCPAPCVYEVDTAFYKDQVRAVALFLDGRHDELSRELETNMKDASREMRFELAIVYRDQLRAIDIVRDSQRVVASDELDRDVIGLYREGDLAEIALLYVRGGRLLDVVTFSVKQAEVPDEEILSGFVSGHYSDVEPGEGGGAFIPPEIILAFEPDAIDGVSEWLSERAGHHVAVIHPKRGHKVSLLNLACENARHSFTEKRRQAADFEERILDLKERLRLAVAPRRIECCDISHLGGGDTVGAIVAMKNGLPDKKRYRSFHVRRKVGDGLNDDYASMYEVLSRRFRRAVTAVEDASLGDDGGAEGGRAEANESSWALPDLFVVDGGRGQLGVALTAAHDLGLHDLAIVGLAKERETVDGTLQVDRVYLPGQKNPIPLNSRTTSLYLLAQLRDEAHRFSNLARERLGKRRRMKSALDDIGGVGPKTKLALLRALGTVQAIAEADDATLLAIEGVNRRHVAAIRASLPKVRPEPEVGGRPLSLMLPEEPPSDAPVAGSGASEGGGAGLLSREEGQENSAHESK